MQNGTHHIICMTPSNAYSTYCIVLQYSNNNNNNITTYYLSFLQLIYQQPGPGVYFEYSVPLHNTDPTPEPDAPSGIIPLGECNTQTYT